MKIESPAFTHADPVPERFRARGGDRSPPLRWSGLPAECRALALIMKNPDAEADGRAHWVVYNIPASREGLPEGLEHRGDLSDGTLQGVCDFHTLGWCGPNPRPGSTARYRFTLFALDQPLPLPPGADATRLESAMEGHVLDQSELTVTAATPLFSH